MGAGKKQTIGHRYFVGLHMVLCRQADALLEITMATKEAWRGAIGSGRGTFNKPNLFGGDEKEGGISGAFDFLRGETTQPVNDYLARALGALVPAYRGVVSLVFRRPYIGANSARLPTMKFKLLNIAGIHRGWYPEKAPINVEAFGDAASIYIAWNVPGNTTAPQLAAMKSWLTQVIGSIGGAARVYVQKFGVETSEAQSVEPSGGTGDYEPLLQWIDDQEVPVDSGSQSDWRLAFEAATTFFSGYDGGHGANFPTGSLVQGLGVLAGSISSMSTVDGERNVVILLGLHNPTPASIPFAQAVLDDIQSVEVYAFRMDSTDVADYELIDNTPIDGVPTIDSSDPDASSFLAFGLLASWADVNPAHIIRCLWTDPMRGGIATDAEIGDSFQAAADLFFTEKLGLSPRFNGTGSVEQDRLDVERHADCVSFRSRQTGKIEIKPIRNDYNPIDLPVLDSSIVLEWGNLEREIASETPNQLTVVYTKRKNGETASVTRTNIAGVRRSGRVIPAEPVEYPACTVEELATRLCLRDLSVQVRPLLSGTLVLAYFPPDLDIGEPFIINEPKLKIENLVVRIVEVQEGDGTDNSVTVRVTEDRYALPSDVAVVPGGPAPVDALLPQASPQRVVMEAPYYMVVLDGGQAETDAALATEPDLGTLIATGTKATAAHRDITVGLDVGAGYVDAGSAEFVTAALTLSALTAEADDDVVTVEATPALDGITANSLAMIDDEIVRIDAMAANGTDVDITIGRGCLDTVPAAHGINSALIFLQNADVREEQYLATETVNVKLLTNLSSRRLALNVAPEDSVTFASRAIRPYPPGGLQINGSYAWDQFVADAVLSWPHRDRTQQTTLVPEDATAGDIGPEAGTTYNVTAEALNEDRFPISTLVDTNVGGTNSYDWNDATALPDGTTRVRFTVRSERDGYESWQSGQIELAVLFPPENILVTPISGGFNITWDDANSGAMQEDDILIYRDTSPFDFSSLPAVLATLAADTESYDDTTTTPATSYYYAVVMRRGSLVAGRFFGPWNT